MIICLRHGKTDWNAKELGGDAEVIRGNIDIPLNDEGRQEVYDTAATLCRDYPIAEVRSTPNYKRDTETRAIVAQVCGVPQVDAPELDPLNVGNLSGKAVGAAIWAIIALLMEIPTIPFPQGETYQDFLKEWGDYFHKTYAQYGGDDSRAVVLVVHGNELRALPALTGQGPIESYQKQKVAPGEFVVVH